MAYMCGLHHSNKDFSEEDSFGKNTFTTAFPVALSNYIYSKGLPMNYIRAAVDEAGTPFTEQVLVALENIIGIDPADAYFAFEDSYAVYDNYATTQANRSDVVIRDRHTGKEVSAFEVKLVAVPTSGTANRPRNRQLCELVVRPPSVEQLCFSIAASFGKRERLTISDIIVEALGNPLDYDWNNHTYMLDRLPAILKASNELTRQGLSRQAPFALMGIWRTKGQEPEFDDECFDAFYWSNFAFLQLFANVARSAIDRGSREIGRPERALIWFVKSMFDYAAQGTVTFERTHSLITFGPQTDKAGSFTNENIAPFVLSDNFIHPRINSDEYTNIITPDGIAYLKPERRLDAVIISTNMRDLLDKLESSEQYIPRV